LIYSRPQVMLPKLNLAPLNAAPNINFTSRTFYAQDRQLE
jgi:hypothetical protein